MRFAIATLAVLAVAATDRSGCSSARNVVPDPIDPACERHACGEFCEFCPPDVPPESCPVPTFAPTACNARGECVTAGTFVCAPEDCDGKACGDECVIDPPCRDATPPCMMPSMPGHCDAAARCIPWELPYVCADPTCDGKACGDECNPCAPAACMSPVAYACDRLAQCVPRVPWICYDPCAGKVCGDDCTACPPDAPDCYETAVVKACDAAGACVAKTPGLCPAG